MEKAFSLFKLLIVSSVFLLIGGCGQGEKEDILEGLNVEDYNLEIDNGRLSGSLLLPEGEGPFPIALIIQGSGPTDRDGNNPIIGKNNSLKLLARELERNNIASVRYDKRGIGESKNLVDREDDLIFEDYIGDAKSFMNTIKEDGRFNEFYVIGHSEGALIGKVLARDLDIQGFISLAGVGEPISETLKRQLKPLPEDLYEESLLIIEDLIRGNMVENISKDLEPVFRKSVQAYLISWFKYNPVDILREIKVPVLLIQGDNDLQVTLEDAKKLEAAKGDRLVIIGGMNHILKDAPRDQEGNLEVYKDPIKPLNEQLVSEIVGFIRK